MNMKGDPFPSLGMDMLNPYSNDSGPQEIVVQKQYLDEYMPVYWACMNPMGNNPDYSEPADISNAYTLDNLNGRNPLTSINMSRIYGKLPILGIPGEDIMQLSDSANYILGLDTENPSKILPAIASWYLIRAMYVYQVHLMLIGHYQLAPSRENNILDIKNTDVIGAPNHYLATPCDIGGRVNPENVGLRGFNEPSLSQSRSVRSLKGRLFSSMYQAKNPMRVHMYSDSGLHIMQERGASMLPEWAAQKGIIDRFGIKGVESALIKAAENAVVYAKRYALSNKKWATDIIDQLKHIIEKAIQKLSLRSIGDSSIMADRFDLYDRLQQGADATLNTANPKSVKISDIELFSILGAPCPIVYTGTQMVTPSSYRTKDTRSIESFMTSRGYDKESMESITSTLALYALTNPNTAFSLKSSRYLRNVTQSEFRDLFLGSSINAPTSRNCIYMWRPKLTKGYDSIFMAGPGVLFGSLPPSAKARGEYPIVMGMLKLEKALSLRMYSIENYLRNVYALSYIAISEMRSYVKNPTGGGPKIIRDGSFHFFGVQKLIGYITNGTNEFIPRNVGEVIPDAIWTPSSPFARAYEWPSVSTMVRGYIRRAGKVPLINSPAYSAKTIITITKQLIQDAKISEDIGVSGSGDDELPAVRQERDGEDEVLFDAPVPIRVPETPDGTNTQTLRGQD